MLPSATELFAEGVRTVRARIGLHLACIAILVIPSVLLQTFVIGDQSGPMVALIRAVVENDVQRIQALSAELQTRSAWNYLGTAWFFVVVEAYTVVATKAALATHRGEAPSLLDCLASSWRAIPWLLLLDFAAGFGIYVGCACCCFPGVGLMLAFAAYLALVPVVMVEENLNLFDAWTRSVALTAGQRGTQIGLLLLVLVPALVYSTVLFGIAVTQLAATTGSLYDGIGAAYRTFMWLSRFGGWVMWVFYAVYVTARVAAYVHLARRAAPENVAAVFR